MSEPGSAAAPYRDERGRMILEVRLTVQPETGEIVEIEPPEGLDYADRSAYWFWVDKAKTHLRELGDAR